MSEPSDWVPQLTSWNDHGGVWAPYCEVIYAIFRKGFIETRPQLDGMPVSCRIDPIFERKEAGFWHCISDAPSEADRTPDPQRCERIGWARAVIENCTDDRIDRWRNDLRREFRQYLWFAEQYLVVLGERRNYRQFITAFCTTQPHRIKKLRKEMEESEIIQRAKKN